MTFRVGQKVVCIANKHGKTGPRGEVLPVKGEVYTVRDTLCGANGDPAIRLVEIVNEPLLYMNGFAECDFYAHSFRPVKTTDISIFTAMLAPGPNAPACKTVTRETAI